MLSSLRTEHKTVCAGLSVLNMHVLVDLRQELAVRERTSDVSRMSAPSSPTLDTDKTDSAVQASLSLPATPVGKNMEHPFIASKGWCCIWSFAFIIIDQ